MSRERQVFPRDQVAHLWANRSQDSARDPGGNFYFTGDTLFSYGSHHVIAHHLPARYDRDGAHVVLINSDTYSPTTNRHHSSMYNALSRSVARIYVDGMRSEDVRDIESRGANVIISRLIKTLKHEAEQATRRGIRQKTRDELRERIAGLRNDALHLLSVDEREARDAKSEPRRYLGRYGDAHAASLLTEWRRNLKTWRATLDVLPFAPGADRAAAEAYARELMRAEWLERAEELTRRAARNFAELVTYEANGRAHRIADMLHIVDSLTSEARELFRKAAKREPRALRDLVRDIAANRSRLETAARDAAIREARETWPLAERDAREGTEDADAWRIARALDRLREAARVLADEPGADERAAFIETAAADHLRLYQAGALEKARAKMAAAREQYGRGEFQRAAQNAREACGMFERNGGTEDEARDAESVATHAGARIGEELAARVDEWRRGERSDMPSAYKGPTLLRVRGRRIETSRGAEVPTRVARILWRVVCSRRAGVWSDISRTPYAGLSVGSFRLDDVDSAGGLHVGCHYIGPDELDRMAAALGFPSCDVVAAAPSDDDALSLIPEL